MQTTQNSTPFRFVALYFLFFVSTKLLTSKPFRRLTFLSRWSPLTPRVSRTSGLPWWLHEENAFLCHLENALYITQRSGSSLHETGRQWGSTVGKRKIPMALANDSSALQRDQSYCRDVLACGNKRLDTRFEYKDLARKEGRRSQRKTDLVEIRSKENRLHIVFQLLIHIWKIRDLLNLDSSPFKLLLIYDEFNLNLNLKIWKFDRKCEV